MKLFSRLGAAFGALIVLLLSGCGGGGSGTVADTTAQSCSGSCGGAAVTITDAVGDFTTYAVTLKSLQLKKVSGAAVETLPSATTVDFAQLVDLSELLSNHQIPAGAYDSASITVDYTGATIIVDDGSATGLTIAQDHIVDTSGTPVTEVTLNVQFDKKHFVVTPGKVAHLALDFNLAASNQFDSTTDTVTVSPFVVASVVPSDTKQIRVRGTLASVDTANSDYVVNVRPCHVDTGTAGQVTVNVSDATMYEIDGVAYSGADGLTALAALPVGTLTAAFGTLSTSDNTFAATKVLAGTSLEGDFDYLLGDVVARSGNTLTVHGIEIGRHDGHFEFGRSDVTVTIGDGTKVTKEGQIGDFTIADISVGQRIYVFGTATEDTASAESFDATAGRVRLAITPIFGTVSNTVAPILPTMTSSGSVTMALQAIDGRAVSDFDFTGTNSDPTQYVVDTQALSLNGLQMGAPARFFGFVTPFGSAPPDFTAVTTVTYANVEVELNILWGIAGTTAPFSSQSDTMLVPDITTSLVHNVEIGPLHTTLTTGPMIVPDTASSTQLYAIGHVLSHTVDNFSSFADFEAALATALDGSNVAVGITASGTYDSGANQFKADRMIVALKN